MFRLSICELVMTITVQEGKGSVSLGHKHCVAPSESVFGNCSVDLCHHKDEDIPVMAWENILAFALRFEYIVVYSRWYTLYSQDALSA